MFFSIPWCCSTPLWLECGSKTNKKDQNKTKKSKNKKLIEAFYEGNPINPGSGSRSGSGSESRSRYGFRSGSGSGSASGSHEDFTPHSLGFPSSVTWVCFYIGNQAEIKKCRHYKALKGFIRLLRAL